VVHSFRSFFATEGMGKEGQGGKAKEVGGTVALADDLAPAKEIAGDAIGIRTPAVGRCAMYASETEASLSLYIAQPERRGALPVP